MNGYNFTERVRKVLAMARANAEVLHHDYVSTEHILLGILREGEGVASAVLQSHGADLVALASRVEALVQPGTAVNAGPDLPYTSRAKRVLELAMAEARELSHTYVGTEHVLIALVREEHGIAAVVLTEAGMTVDSVRSETLRLLGTGIPGREETPGDMAPAATRPHDEGSIAEIRIKIRHRDGSTVRGYFRSASTAMLFLRRNSLGP